MKTSASGERNGSESGGSGAGTGAVGGAAKDTEGRVTRVFLGGVAFVAVCLGVMAVSIYSMRDDLFEQATLTMPFWAWLGVMVAFTGLVGGSVAALFAVMDWTPMAWLKWWREPRSEREIAAAADGEPYASDKEHNEPNY